MGEAAVPAGADVGAAGLTPCRARRRAFFRFFWETKRNEHGGKAVIETLSGAQRVLLWSVRYDLPIFAESHVTNPQANALTRHRSYQIFTEASRYRCAHSSLRHTFCDLEMGTDEITSSAPGRPRSTTEELPNWTIMMTIGQEKATAINNKMLAANCSEVGDRWRHGHEWIDSEGMSNQQPRVDHSRRLDSSIRKNKLTNYILL